MPQARSSGKSPSSRSKAAAKPAAAKPAAAKPAAAKSAAAKSAAAKSAAAKPAAASPATGATRGTRAKSSKPASAKPTAQAAPTKAAATSTTSAHLHDPRLEAAAQRVRKLNERIIEAGKEAGETTLTSYEKALKAIAATIERRADSTEIDWISNLATTQAKFIRDVTDAWTKAAREMLKK